MATSGPCLATGKDVEVAVVGERSTITLKIVDDHKELIKLLEVELISVLTSVRTPGRLERRIAEKEYEFSYQPTVKGWHKLHVKVKGQHIEGSPFTISVKSPVERIGGPLLALGKVVGPWGVTVNQKGEVLVTEWIPNCCCVTVFSGSGEKIRSFGMTGTEEGEFRYPHGVAVDRQGNIFVADGSNHRIQKFTADGQFLMAAGKFGRFPDEEEPLEFNQPLAITYDANNDKLYVTDCNSHIQVLNSDLTFSGFFGKYGSGKGQYSSPYDIACDSTGKVYVVDYSKHCVLIFTAKGKFITKFGKQGEGKGKLNWPRSIACDGNDLLYISEERNNRVSVFTTKGNFVTSFGSSGYEPGQFAAPHGIAVDSNGVVYVCDTENHRIQIF